MERDKTGRIITGNNKNRDDRQTDRDSDRSRDRVVVLRERMPPKDDWNNREDAQGQGGQRNTYGLSQQFLESLGIEGDLIPKVFVSNVSKCYDFSGFCVMCVVCFSLISVYTLFSWIFVWTRKNLRKFFD